MKANAADVPYGFDRRSATTWGFTLAYAPLDRLLPLAHEQLAASRLPYSERIAALQVPASMLLLISG